MSTDHLIIDIVILKVVLVNETDISGGAARACHRIHCALNENGHESTMIVNHTILKNSKISGPSTSFQKFLVRLRLVIGNRISFLQNSQNPILHSVALLPSLWLGKINSSKADIVNLHWINGEMLSIEDIPKIKIPIVWTLHDMWAFCGAEHLALDERFITGYYNFNRPSSEAGFPLNNWVWKRKLRSWRRPIHIITPSQHMANCVKESFIMRDWPVTVIPNPLDLNTWCPMDKSIAKNVLGLPNDRTVIAFGALGINQEHKGFDLLKKAILSLASLVPNPILLIFGNEGDDDLGNFGVQVHSTGLLADDISLRIVYCAADVMVVPSRFESFGQTASEAQACGTPVVAFNIAGLQDIVIHKQSGYLAVPFDPKDLAAGIHWVIENSEHENLASNSRKNAIKKFSYEVVSKQYIEVYKSVLNKV